MRKYQGVLHHQSRSARASRYTYLFFGAILLAVCPIAYELGYIIFANWRTMAGQYTVASTPILDTMSEWARVLKLEVHSQSSWMTSGHGLKASTAVPFAIAWAVIMALVFLRKVR